jgi:hypothetical protein
MAPYPSEGVNQAGYWNQIDEEIKDVLILCRPLKTGPENEMQKIELMWRYPQQTPLKFSSRYLGPNMEWQKKGW